MIPRTPPRRGQLIALLVLAWSSPLRALVPNEIEWAAWPDYCRARFVVAGDGRDSEFVNRVPGGEVGAWKARMGPAWYALHHHCYGLVFVSRARQAQNDADRMYRLSSAIREQTFAINRTPADHPMYAVMASQIGLAHQLRREYPQAEEAFGRAVKSRPTDAIGYQGLALLYREQKRLDDARRVLEDGDRATGGQSSEINYFLGLVLLDQKDYAPAREYARKAYALGYPLPGLRDKLARAGYPLD